MIKFPHLRQDFAASLVVFLVALPLCVGVAVASGVPAELGLVTGIVGGIVAGLMRGSSLQVSGPAAGLTVLVFEAVRQFGPAALGVIVLGAGLLQLLMGVLKLGRWFRAISVAVVEGMLAGIGLVIIAGQSYAAAGLKAPASGIDKITGLPDALVRAAGSPVALTSLGVGAGTIAVMVLWKRMPKRARAVPGALAAVLLATLASLAFELPLATVGVQGLLDAVQPPGADAFGQLAQPAIFVTILAFALIASAESLFSAAAVDRLHDGPRTDYDKELVAQGAGNTVCGLLGALPMTAVGVQGLLDAVQPPGADAFGQLAQPAIFVTILAFALIASAESLFSAAAVDRLHDGPRTDYDKELVAQGAGNTVCGLLGALPMTAVIVRSSANVQAGAKTKASRVLHGVWLLMFAALLPSVLELIPLPALAGILVHAGWKLIPFRQIVLMWAAFRGEALILVATAVSIVTVNMFEGVLIGLALSVAKTAWQASHVNLEVVDKGAGPVQVYLSGNATFLRLPKILDSLEALPRNRSVELDLSGLHHVDHACRTALRNWAERHGTADTEPVSDRAL
ncbi:SulP family inorganic anion transporter [Streptomyces sp. NPDC006512]|uniref:SulP family inorganic anion transporter n=1 Tax=Streptomyces sp. NPDC006512 TaxID=3154307 RepID=UPI00339F61CD